jgi:hypothetical protein
MLLGDIKRAVAASTDVILFNIDSKADSREGRDAVTSAFLRVLNEMQGFGGNAPHIAVTEPRETRSAFDKGKMRYYTAVVGACSHPWELKPSDGVHHKGVPWKPDVVTWTIPEDEQSASDSWVGSEI